MTENKTISVGLFENIDNQICGCDIIKIDDDFEMRKYLLKDGSVFEVPAFSDMAKMFEKVGMLSQKPMTVIPKTLTGVENFCHQILNNIEAYFLLKEFGRYAKFCNNEYMIEDLGCELFSASEDIKYYLGLAAKVSPLWWQKEVPGHPELKYYCANPYNILGWDHKYDYLIPEESRNVIYERNIMLDLASSEVPIELTENQLFDCICELRLANKKYNLQKKKVLK